MNNKLEYSNIIKTEAKRLGFVDCGISKVQYLKNEEIYLKEWLDKDMHGEMKYMENHFEKRLDPSKLVEGAKSIISVLFNYYSSENQKDTDAPKISKYAYGKDYHHIIKNKLNKLLHFINSNITKVNGRYFTDSAPVLERVWAKEAGLGWIGKNSLLINKKYGSFCFIGELIIDIELEYDKPIKDYCGTCNKCVESCPVNAIIKPFVVDASKCISYFTIEKKGNIPDNMKGKFNNWIFGCDICQNVCPWNKKLETNYENAFIPKQEMLKMTKNDWYNLTQEKFNLLFKDSPIQRTKYSGLKRNIEFIRE
ncbi:MAG: tRNA epoxyqueuosine(34) reductase QueG [Bacteroidales bacterium]|nr:tRNA epoxyqueuosine(34) reductase QueG [Bacteroidales bacterium]